MRLFRRPVCLAACLRLRSLALLVLLPVLVSACSQVGLAYRNLDWLVPWRLNDYLSLDSTQQAWLKPRVQQHLTWHCSQELPRYLDWLNETQRLVTGPAPSAEQLLARFADVDAAIKRLTVEVTPTAIELLKGLNDSQVEALYAAMDEDNVEDRQDFLEPDLATQHLERAERLEDRLRNWLGRLNAEQQARVTTWAEGLGEQNRYWLENRARWQDAFRQSMAQRDQPDFGERLTHLLQNREAYYSDDYRAAYPRSRAALASLFSDLLAQATDAQRERLGHHLRDLQRDLAAQVCSSAEV
ncbi:MAG: hypothetical protein KJ884_19785 [Gammaproteobacteria bacterium]|nr:hypothetical protein [Gammaproteobacteria bacterium]MBU2140250.1 hypothetical protein [Gammaproteobacteria bacterium]MBU2217195.1 hypothetical protein [Gammaproteobacteria bacterium]MBU2325198.1 hypothetical protein [Gammaproteobacteria bacterium]